MPRLRPTRIGSNDLLGYLEASSDFDFELTVLKLLNDQGLQCEHGGLYDDSVTGKSRQFDIRAYCNDGDMYVRLPVECKNIRANFPVLVHRVLRQPGESYHQVVHIVPEQQRYQDYSGSNGLFTARFPMPSFLLQEDRIKVVTLHDNDSIYPCNEYVGKGTTQVGVSNDGEYVSNDSELYGKWEQALSSATELAEQLFYGLDDSSGASCAAILPIVVIPNDRLWVVDYDTTGQRRGGPQSVDRCTCYVDKAYKIFVGTTHRWMRISHIEILTVDGLSQFITQYLSTETGLGKIFPAAAVLRELQATSSDDE